MATGAGKAKAAGYRDILFEAPYQPIPASVPPEEDFKSAFPPAPPRSIHANASGFNTTGFARCRL